MTNGDLIIGIVMHDGVVQRVVVNDHDAEGAPVIVMHEDGSQLIETCIDTEICAHLKKAADASACVGIGMAAEIASEALARFSQQDHRDPRAALLQVRAIMSALCDALHVAAAVGTSRADRE